LILLSDCQTTNFAPLPLHDALPIWFVGSPARAAAPTRAGRASFAGAQARSRAERADTVRRLGDLVANSPCSSARGATSHGPNSLSAIRGNDSPTAGNVTRNQLSASFPRNNFPVALRGSSARKTTSRGVLYRARFAFT